MYPLKEYDILKISPAVTHRPHVVFILCKMKTLKATAKNIFFKDCIKGESSTSPKGISKKISSVMISLLA